LNLTPAPYSGERHQGSQAGFAFRKLAEQALAEVLGKVHAHRSHALVVPPVRVVVEVAVAVQLDDCGPTEQCRFPDGRAS
jgi:hypothetical protein